jgi:hypothetical protein
VKGNQTNNPKKIWIRTQKKEVLTAAVEAGLDTFVFTKETEKLAEEWSSLVGDFLYNSCTIPNVSSNISCSILHAFQVILAPSSTARAFLDHFKRFPAEICSVTSLNIVMAAGTHQLYVHR